MCNVIDIFTKKPVDTTKMKDFPGGHYLWFTRIRIIYANGASKRIDVQFIKNAYSKIRKL